MDYNHHNYKPRDISTIEQEKRGLWKIVVTEIPYQVSKGKLIEKIAQLVIDKKLPMLDDIRDESAFDTPGIFDAKTKFEKAMLDNAFGILNDVDLIYLLIDCKKSLDKLDSIFTEKIKVVKHKTFLILNKIDLIKRSDLLEKVNWIC